MASVNASLFKTTEDFNNILNFFKEKGMIEKPNPVDLEEDLENIKHKYYEISSTDDLMFLAIYKNKEDVKSSENVLKKNIYVNYGLLIKNDLSEYRFTKYEEGTDKILRLRKKKEDFNGAFIKKLDKLKYDDFESFESIFDRSEFIKEFYQLYCDAKDYLIKNIKGIPDEEDKEFFANLIIQRIMFLWFLQKKGFLNNNENYFIDKFKEITSNNKNYYKDFLQKLFFNGLCKKESKRESYINKLIGDVPYLNGGLFIESESELKYGNSIEICNEAFFKEMVYPIQNHEHNVPILNLMDCKDWTVSGRSGEVDKLDPEILGYIFEKSINQKDLGAVYTPEEITSYICKNTIYPHLIDKLNKEFRENFEYKNDIESDFLNKLNRKQLEYLSITIKDLRILDPAVGSGHFLVDTIIALEKIYIYLTNANIIDCNKFQIRHYIITESLYGVDLLPGAVEICKLRLFLALAETFKKKRDVKPLPNIEFNIRCGNSLVGFTSESELGQKFISTGPIINTLNRNMAFFRNHAPQVAEQSENILLTFKNKFKIDPFSLFRLRTSLVKIYKNLHDHDLQTEFRSVIYDITDAINQELNSQFYTKIIPVFEKKKELKKLKNRKKVEFYNKLHPFHWLMEYSEIFEKGGFDLVIGNPPWDKVKPTEKEFFYKYDQRLTKFGVDKKKAKQIIIELLKDEEIDKEWQNYKVSKILEATYYVKSGDYQFQSDKINGRTVSGDLNLYKLFTERFHQLNKNNSYCGIVIPSGFYTDAGSKGLRRLIFDKTTLKELYCFENKKGIFETIHKSFKFILMVFKKSGKTDLFKAAFMLQDTSILKKIESNNLDIEWELIKKLSPSSYTIIEFKNEKDLEIVKKMYQNPTLSKSIGIKWLKSEMHMTNDNPIFNTDKDGLTLYEGKMINQYVSDYDKPKYWVNELKALNKFGKNYEDYKHYRLCFRAIARSTDTRTMISTILPKNVFVGNSLIITKRYDNNSNRLITENYTLYLCGIFNSFILDYLLRLKVSANLNMFMIYELPIPEIDENDPLFKKIVKNVAKLICVSDEFKDLKNEIGIEGISDENERKDIKNEIENSVKELYNLNDSEHGYILNHFNQSD